MMCLTVPPCTGSSKGTGVTSSTRHHAGLRMTVATSSFPLHVHVPIPLSSQNSWLS